MEGWGGSGVPDMPPQSADSCFPHCQRQDLHYCRAKQSWTVPSCTHTAENALPLQQRTLLGWVVTASSWHYSVSCQPPGTDKMHIPWMENPPALHCNTVFTKEQEAVRKQQGAVALGVSTRSLAPSFLQGMNSRAGHTDTRDKAEGTGCTIKSINCAAILQSRGVPLGARTVTGPLL